MLDPAADRTYLGAGISPYSGGTARVRSKVEAESVEAAIEQLQEKFQRRGDTLIAVYSEWHYNYKGALRGKRVWERGSEQ